MTYCCALRLQDGLVFISDTRTNAGVDHISVFRKLYTFGVEGERFIAIQTSGNLATTQAVIGHLKNHLELSQEPNLYSVNTMFELILHPVAQPWHAQSCIMHEVLFAFVLELGQHSGPRKHLHRRQRGPLSARRECAAC